MTDKFAPGWILTTCVAMALAVLLWLGFWQLERLDEKTDFLEQIDASMRNMPVAFPAEVAEPEAWEYKKVALIGAINNESPLCIVGRNGKNEIGLFSLFPLTLVSGQQILAVSGWNQLDDMSNIQCSSDKVNVPGMEYTGIIRRPTENNMFTPEADLENKVWYKLDIPSMAESLGSDKLLPLLLDQASVSEFVIPVTYMPLSVPNDHLQYALTWFGLAVMLIGVYIAFGMQRASKKD